MVADGSARNERFRYLGTEYIGFDEANPANWDISVAGGKDINRDSVSSGERTRADQASAIHFQVAERLWKVSAVAGDSPVCESDVMKTRVGRDTCNPV